MLQYDYFMITLLPTKQTDAPLTSFNILTHHAYCRLVLQQCMATNKPKSNHNRLDFKVPQRSLPAPQKGSLYSRLLAKRSYHNQCIIAIQMA